MDPKTIRQLGLDYLLDTALFAPDDAPPIDTSFPVDEADQLATEESYNKHLYRPNTYLHKWWARRSGTTFRHILKGLVEDPVARKYYAPGGLAGKIVLDPMMGGATTLHEAIRMGASVIGADVDPIPVVQARATLSEVSLASLRSAFHRFYEDLYKRVGQYFRTECPQCDHAVDSLYALHGLRKRCGCSEVVQIDQYELRHERDRIIRICPDSWSIYEGSDQPNAGAQRPRLITRRETQCPTCGEKYRDVLDEPYYARYVPIAIAGNCPTHGLFFRSPGTQDLARLSQAKQFRENLDFAPLEDFCVAAGPKSGDLLARNIHSYLDLFSPRELVYIWHAIDLVQGYHAVVKLNLALLVSTSLEFNSLLCGYKGGDKSRPGAVRHVFSLHAYSFPYTALENNPVCHEPASGNLQRLFRDRIERGRKWASSPVERLRHGKTVHQVPIPFEVDSGVEVTSQEALAHGTRRFMLIQGDSRQLPLASDTVDYVVTDPPYYDNVQYSDLAAFFRVWLSRLLPEEAKWSYDHQSSAVATRATSGDSNFMDAIGGIFAECGRILKKDKGRLIFTFHHWDPNAWAELSMALKRASFRLVNYYVVHAENPVSVHINSLKAIQHDVILVLALDAGHSAPHWMAPQAMEVNDSRSFCDYCGHLLGWTLQDVQDIEEMRSAWRTHLSASSDISAR